MGKQMQTQVLTMLDSISLMLRVTPFSLTRPIQLIPGQISVAAGDCHGLWVPSQAWMVGPGEARTV